MISQVNSTKHLGNSTNSTAFLPVTDDEIEEILPTHFTRLRFPWYLNHTKTVQKQRNKQKVRG